MGYAILKGEGSIREKTRELFTSHTQSSRRVVLGPLAALEPADYFPDIRNVEFYAWGREGLPDSAPLADLTERGVRINWVNPMHLRLYWVKGQGAVIGPGLGAGGALPECHRDDADDLALYLDAGALLAVDEVLGPLLVEPAGRDTFTDLQESCHLLWLLAEGITAAEPLSAQSPEIMHLPAGYMPMSAPGATAVGIVPAAPENRRRAADLENWYEFLAEEARGPEGLLCFYDRPRARRVDYCSRFFVGMGMLFSI